MEEAHDILNIPIPVEPREDEMRWLFTRDGKVAAKSTYHYVIWMSRSDEGRYESPIGASPHLWSVIWKSKMLPKVKVFVWKLASNSIAVRNHL